jgi:hypothetical protein
MLIIQEPVTVEELNNLLDRFISDTQWKINRGKAHNREDVRQEERELYILNELKTNLSEYARI